MLLWQQKNFCYLGAEFTLEKKVMMNSESRTTFNAFHREIVSNYVN